MKLLIKTPLVISVFFTVVVTISSCKKTDSLASYDLEKQVSSLFMKYHFQREAIAHTDGTILLSANDLSDLETQLAAIDRIRLTPQQVDSFKKDFVKGMQTNTANRVTLGYANHVIPQDIVYGNTNVTLNDPGWTPLIVLKATSLVKFARFPTRFTGITNNWLVSGIIPGSGTDDGSSDIIVIGTGVPPSQVVACSKTWLYRITTKITSPFTMEVGYVVRCEGFFNAGPEITTYSGFMHIE